MPPHAGHPRCSAASAQVRSAKVVERCVVEVQAVNGLGGAKGRVERGTKSANLRGEPLG